MSTGPDEVTSTTTTEPPQQLQPLFNIATDLIGGQFGLPGQSQLGALSGKERRQFAKLQRLRDKGKRFKKQSRLEEKLGLTPGGTFSDQPGSLTGLGDLSGIFNNQPGSDLLGQAADLTGSTLAGDFLSPDSNPFLMDIFNRGADTITNRLNTSFAGAGRDLGAARPAAKQEFSDLFANLFGGNFQAERGRQERALTAAQGLDPINQLINRLAALTPNAGGITTSTQPVFQTGLF